MLLIISVMYNIQSIWNMLCETQDTLKRAVKPHDEYNHHQATMQHMNTIVLSYQDTFILRQPNHATSAFGVPTSHNPSPYQAHLSSIALAVPMLPHSSGDFSTTPNTQFGCLSSSCQSVPSLRICLLPLWMA